MNPEYDREPIRRNPVEHRLRIDQQMDALNEVIRRNPGVRRYIDIGAVHSAGTRLKAAGKLPGMPAVLAQLRDAHSADPSKVTLVLIPDLPLVVAQQDDRVSIFAPVLGCTMKAIDELCHALPQSIGVYEIVQSQNTRDELEAKAWKIAQKNPKAILPYDPKLISPQDYVALGAMGILSNEVFRTSIASA